MQVGLCRSLASQGVKARVLNQSLARIRIRIRCPEGFMFQLKAEEWTAMRAQIVTSSPSCTALSSQIVMSKMAGGRRTLPYASTEQGVVILSGVLRSQFAVEVNIAIMRTFVQLRRLMDCHLLVRRKKFNMRQTALLESARPQRNIWGCQRPVFGVGNQDVADKGGRQIRVVQGRFTDQRPELNLSGNGATLCVCMRFGLGVQVAINAYGNFHEVV